MTLDNMAGITKGRYTGFCKSQLITCNRVKECNGVCPFEDALKHADKTQTMNDQHTVDHDRDWIIGCIEHDGFIHTHRFDKANQIIHDALSAEAVSKGVLEQFRWERDVAMAQLEEYGIPFGTNKDEDMVRVVRCKDCKHYSVKGKTTQFGFCGYRHAGTDETDYCSRAVRRKE